MPTYEYRCRNGHTFEVIQSMSDEPITACQQCQAPVERVFHPVAVHFKGSGFYTTDYGRKRNAGGGDSGGDSDSGGGDSAKSDSKESAGAKSDTKSESSKSESSSKGAD